MKLCPLLLFIMLCALPVQAQWRDSGRPANAPIKVLRAAGSNLYAAINGQGIFVTSDNGASWRAINGNLPNLRVNDLLVYSFTNNVPDLFVATDGAGIFRSQDNGQSWVAVNDGLGILTVRQLGRSATGLFALCDVGASRTALYRNFLPGVTGTTWQFVTQPKPNEPIRALSSVRWGDWNIFALYPNEIYNGYSIVGPDFAWGKFAILGDNPVITPTKVAVNNTKQPAVLYVATTSAGVLWGHGLTYQQNAVGLNRNPLNDLVVDFGEYIYAATPAGIFRRKDTDPIWQWYSAGLGDLKTTSLAVVNGRLWVGTESGAVYSNDGTLPSLIVASSASYAPANVAPAMMATMFSNLPGIETAISNSLPLPNQLSGTSLTIRDAGNVERICPLFYVSGAQINFLLPSPLVLGPAQITVNLPNGSKPTGLVYVREVAPSIFTANANGQGVPAALVLRIVPGGTQIYEPVAQYNVQQKIFVPVPIDVGGTGEQVYLIIFGTGIRGRRTLNDVTAQLGGVNLPVSYAGPAPGFEGLDQVNVLLPANPRNRGLLNLLVSVASDASNTVQVHIR